MKRSAVVLSCILLAAAAVAAPAQVAPSANARQFSITVGGMASVFQPDYTGGFALAPDTLWYPFAQAVNQPLIGPGAFFDVKFRRWVQIEGEARWLRFNRAQGVYGQAVFTENRVYTDQDTHEDNYLIGPRVPVYHFWKATVYAKALAGFSKMDLGGGEHGTFTATAFGGGMDVRLTKRISIRAFDGEYQYWPDWGNSKLFPYGASAGVSYRIF
jgi:hypothetical protein